MHLELWLGPFLEIQAVAFDQADLGLRLAETLTGEVESPGAVFRSEKYGDSGILIHTAKTHPQLAGGI